MNVIVCEYHLIIVSSLFMYSILMCTCHNESLYKGGKWNKRYQFEFSPLQVLVFLMVNDFFS
jgi:hypothetical protein